MAATINFNGPPPPPGQKWCVVCARLYKGEYLKSEIGQRLIDRVNRLGPEELVEFHIPSPVKGMPVLNVAVAQAMVPMAYSWAPGQQVTGAADVCWGHLEAMNPSAGSTIVAARPGDMPHERGAAVLGRG